MASVLFLCVYTYIRDQSRNERERGRFIELVYMPRRVKRTLYNGTTVNRLPDNPYAKASSMWLPLTISLYQGQSRGYFLLLVIGSQLYPQEGLICFPFSADRSFDDSMHSVTTSITVPHQPTIQQQQGETAVMSASRCHCTVERRHRLDTETRGWLFIPATPSSNYPLSRRARHVQLYIPSYYLCAHSPSHHHHLHPHTYIGIYPPW